MSTKNRKEKRVHFPNILYAVRNSPWSAKSCFVCVSVESGGCKYYKYGFYTALARTHPLPPAPKEKNILGGNLKLWARRKVSCVYMKRECWSETVHKSCDVEGSRSLFRFGEIVVASSFTFVASWWTSGENDILMINCVFVSWLRLCYARSTAYGVARRCSFVEMCNRVSIR